MSTITPNELLEELTLGSSRGRQMGVELQLVVERELGPEDVPMLMERTSAKETVGLAHIRSAHHRLAQLLCQGLSNTEVSAITGYSPVRIKDLQRVPSFQELLAHYGAVKEVKFADLMEKLATLGESAADELIRRLEEDGENWTKSELMQVSELAVKARVASKGAESGRGEPQGPLVKIEFVQSQPTAFPSRITLEGKIE